MSFFSESEGRNVKKIGVVGAGVMGSGIASLMGKFWSHLERHLWLCKCFAFLHFIQGCFLTVVNWLIPQCWMALRSTFEISSRFYVQNIRNILYIKSRSVYDNVQLCLAFIRDSFRDEFVTKGIFLVAQEMEEKVKRRKLTRDEANNVLSRVKGGTQMDGFKGWYDHNFANGDNYWTKIFKGTIFT